MPWVLVTACTTWTVVETLTGRMWTYMCCNGVCTVTVLGG